MLQLQISCLQLLLNVIEPVPRVLFRNLLLAHERGKYAASSESERNGTEWSGVKWIRLRIGEWHGMRGSRQDRA